MVKVRFSYWVIGMVLITSSIVLSILSTIPPFASLTMLNAASAANALLVPLGIILSMGSRDTSAVHFWMATVAGITAAVAIACAFAWWVARYPAKWSLCELYCQSLQEVVAP
jgi:hypothetical protein